MSFSGKTLVYKSENGRSIRPVPLLSLEVIMLAIHTDLGNITHRYFWVGQQYYRLALGAPVNELEGWGNAYQAPECRCAWERVGLDAVGIYNRAA